MQFLDEYSDEEFLTCAFYDEHKGVDIILRKNEHRVIFRKESLNFPKSTIEGEAIWLDT
jgi:hypothetical protein